MSSSRTKLRPALEDYLIALGIPREKHSFDGLAGYFPPEFKISEAEFETDVLAEILIHLVRAGVIRVDA